MNTKNFFLLFLAIALCFVLAIYLGFEILVIKNHAIASETIIIIVLLVVAILISIFGYMLICRKVSSKAAEIMDKINKINSNGQQQVNHPDELQIKKINFAEKYLENVLHSIACKNIEKDQAASQIKFLNEANAMLKSLLDNINAQTTGK